MWHRFPQPMRETILRALEEAGRLNKAAADPQDLFVALSQVPACSAAHILTRLRAIDSPATSPRDSIAPASALTPEAKKLVVQGYEESALLSDRIIGTDHLLLAIVKSGVPPQLAGRNLTYDRVRREIKRLRKLGFGPDAPISPVNP